MPVIFEGSGLGPTTRYERLPLTGLYLRSARESAESALAMPLAYDDVEQRIKLSTLAVLWSALALEAGANQLAEDLLPASAFDDFDQCRGSFKRPAKVSRTIWKWHQLFAKGPRVEIPLADPLMVAAAALVQTRNQLSHYQPLRSSRKVHYQPPPPVRGPDGMYHVVMWDVNMEPARVEPSLVEDELLGDQPRTHFLAAWNIFWKWEVTNARDGSDLKTAVPPL